MSKNLFVYQLHIPRQQWMRLKVKLQLKKNYYMRISCNSFFSVKSLKPVSLPKVDDAFDRNNLSIRQSTMLLPSVLNMGGMVVL